MNIHQRFSTNSYGWQHWVMDHLHIEPGQRVLELGCGTAALWMENLARLPEGIEVTLSDYSAGMLVAARGGLAGDARFGFFQQDAQAIAAKDQCFDLVIANHMLYHVPDLLKTLIEIRRVLKPGGHLAAATNGQAHLRELYQLGDLFPEQHHVNDSALRFGLENGGARLAEVFSAFELLIYPDSLWVTDAQALFDYIKSMWWVDGWDEARFARLNQVIEKLIREQGGIAIQKSSGMFWAGGER